MSATATAAPRTGRRGWVVLLVLVLVGVVAVLAIGTGSQTSDEPLSVSSTRPDGARALARLLAARGTAVTETDSLDDARGGGADRTVLLLAPDAYAADRLRALAADVSGPLVLLDPGADALDALGAGLTTAADTLPVSGVRSPGCDDPAATSAGPVAFDVATAYAATDDAEICYGGAYARAGTVSALGDPTLLTNAALSDVGTAALSLNLLGSTSQVVFVRPGADTDGPTGSVWSALPDHAEAAALWLLGVGLLLVLWRGRRLGAPVTEPLPVTVRADELVRGRARLYERAGATGRAAGVLRAASTARVRRSLALAPGTPPAEVARAAEHHLRTALPPGLLDGPPPADDDALLRLARDLATLEERVRRPGPDGQAGWSA